MVILINPAAGGGRALERWNRIESRILNRHPSVTPFILENGVNEKQWIGKRINEGETEFVAGGGDGTVNLLVESILEHRSLPLFPNVKLGAIGLGSSNDFHKPFQDTQRIEGIPCKMDFDSTIRRDLGTLTFEDEKGNLHKRYWIINASIGITAEANLFFNFPNALLRLLKKMTTQGAILYSAFHTILNYRNREMEITLDKNIPFETSITNLGIIKSPHFSGNFCYDSPFEPQSGDFYVQLCEKMSLPRAILTLLKLSQRKFSGLPLTRSWRSYQLIVRSDKPFAVEFDGEVISTRNTSFTIQPKLLQICP